MLPLQLRDHRHLLLELGNDPLQAGQVAAEQHAFECRAMPQHLFEGVQHQCRGLAARTPASKADHRDVVGGAQQHLLPGQRLIELRLGFFVHNNSTVLLQPLVIGFQRISLPYVLSRHSPAALIQSAEVCTPSKPGLTERVGV